MPSDKQLKNRVAQAVEKAKLHGIDGTVEELTPAEQQHAAEIGKCLLGPQGTARIGLWMSELQASYGESHSNSDSSEPSEPKEQIPDESTRCLPGQLVDDKDFDMEEFITTVSGRERPSRLLHLSQEALRQHTEKFAAVAQDTALLNGKRSSD